MVTANHNKQTSQVYDFSAFQCVGKCQSLVHWNYSLDMYQLSRVVILFFFILNSPQVHCPSCCSGWQLDSRQQSLSTLCLTFIHFYFYFVLLLSLSNSFSTPRTIAHQPPLSMEFSRREYWSGLPFPSPRDLPNPGTEPPSLLSPALVSGFFTTVPPRKLIHFYMCT